jgi:hypothetical protein
VLRLDDLTDDGLLPPFSPPSHLLFPPVSSRALLNFTTSLLIFLLRNNFRDTSMFFAIEHSL